MSDETDSFYCLGSFGLFEARKMVTRLEQENIRFDLEDDVPNTNDVLKTMPGFGSGACSYGPTVKVFIHRGDEKKFRIISGEFFKI